MVGLVEVLGGQQDVGSGLDSFPGWRPTLRCDFRGPAPWSARRAAAASAFPPGWRPGPDAVACPPNRCAPAGRPRRSAAFAPEFSGPRRQPPSVPGHRAGPPSPGSRGRSSSPPRPPTDRPGRSGGARSWVGRPRRGRRRSACRRRVASSVATMRIKVVLPAPLGPRMATGWPDGRVRLNSERAWTFPKRLLRPSASIRARTGTPPFVVLARMPRLAASGNFGVWSRTTGMAYAVGAASGAGPR